MYWANLSFIVTKITEENVKEEVKITEVTDVDMAALGRTRKMFRSFWNI